jgi:DNA-directed RNA polymerase subunit E'/Rpb7
LENDEENENWKLQRMKKIIFVQTSVKLKVEDYKTKSIKERSNV